MNILPHAGGYVYDGTEVSQLRLPVPVLDIGTLLPTLMRVGSKVLSLIGQGVDRMRGERVYESRLVGHPSLRGDDGGLEINHYKICMMHLSWNSLVPN